MSLEDKEIYMHRGVSLSFKKNSKIIELTFHFEKKQRLFTRVFCFFFLLVLLLFLDFVNDSLVNLNF
jgi:hypothetical protein